MSMKTNFDTVYVHYGADVFDPVITAKNGLAYDWKKAFMGKPSGLWASSVDAGLSWKDWCESEDYHTEQLEKCFRFKIKDGARILEIHQIEDILDYLEKSVDGWTVWLDGAHMHASLNANRLRSEFDGMELYLSENWQLRDQYFYPWDVDSICIWNPDVVEVIKQEEEKEN